MGKNINNMEYEQLREAVRNILKERLDESFFSRLGAAYDTAKDKVMGMGGDIANSYKEEKAFDLYKKYRNLLVKANQMKPKVNAKAAANASYFQKSQPQAQNAYQAAKAYGLSEEIYTAIKNIIAETCADESFWGGLKNIGRNFTNSMKNGNGISGKFNNLKADYSAGDASSDAVAYSKIWSEANTAKKEFMAYCKQNGFDPKAIAQKYQSRVRQGVVSGQDKSKSGLQQATNNGKSKITAAGPSADALNANRSKMRQQRNDANVSRVWENEQ